MPTPCTVTGTLQTLTSGKIAQGKVIFQLTNVGTGNPISVSGTSIFPSLSTTIMTAQDGTFSTPLWGNDNISPSNTLYAVTFRDFQGNEIGPVLFSIAGSTVNLNSASPVNNVLPPVFSGAGLVGAVLLNPPAPQTLSGQTLTLSNTAPLVIQGTESVKNLEGILFADQFSSIQAAINAVPSSGGTVILPQGTTQISSTLTITNPVQLIGLGFSSATHTIAGSTLQWTGGASPLFSITGNSSLALKNFGIDNTGSGTIAIDVDNAGAASNSILIEDVFCINPTVRFSDSFLRVGNNSGANPTVDVRLSRVYALSAASFGLKALRGNLFQLNQCRFVDDLTNDMLIGSATTKVISLIMNEGSLEPNGTANGTIVSIINADSVAFNGTYFECDGTGFAIDIPSTAIAATNVSVNAGARIIGASAGNASKFAVRVAKSSATLSMSNCYVTRFTAGGQAVVTNVAALALTFIGVTTDNTTLPMFDTPGVGITTMIGCIAGASFLGGRIQVPASTAFSFEGTGNVLMASETLTAVAPTVLAGQVGLGATTAASATTGANGAVPAQVAGYLIINVAGTVQKVPYFNT